MFKNCLDLFQYTATPIVRFISRNASVEWGYAWIAIVLASVFAAAAMGAGCANLKDKAVVTSGSVQGLKIIMSADPSTGAVMPQIATGFGEFMIADCPTDSDTFFEYFHQEKSLWSNVAGSTKYIRISGGKGCESIPAVKMLMEPLKEQPLDKGN